MVSLALTADEAKETIIGCASSDPKDMPKYPYGTTLDLNDETLKKLGLDKLPEVGEEVAITCLAKITRISAYEEQEGVERSLGLQIVDMDLNVPSQSAASKLYGGE